MAEENGGDSKLRANLAIIVVSCGIAASLIIGGLVIFLAQEQGDTAKLVMSSLLPLWATWVGTVLAHYFSTANFEAASKSTKELLSLDKKLASIPARQVMIPRSKIVSMVVKAGTTPEQKLIAEIRSEITTNKGQRLPVLYPDDIARYMIHLSTLDQFLANEALKATGAAAGAPAAPTIAQLTLQDLLNKAPDLHLVLEGTFALINESASLADAKLAMETTPNCQDVFVTHNGKKDEAVLGWITNNEIAANSKA